jgi:diadenylate cyclase
MDGVGKIMGVSDKATYFFSNIQTILNWTLILDILIVAVLFYWAYLFLHETRAMRILYGLLVLVILTSIGHLFNLLLLNWILRYFMAMLVVAIPIVFQPELRTALEKLGRTKFLGDVNFSKESNSKVIDEIAETVSSLSKQRIGCLIILQRQTGLREYIETGVKLEAQISNALLSSIFFPRSPLHDGAVIVSGDKIVSAKSILPVSGASINPGLGTRHRAGLGVTEISDAVAVIVSEETGSISIAVGGKLDRRISEERLRSRLSYLLRGSAKRIG